MTKFNICALNRFLCPDANGPVKMDGEKTATTSEGSLNKRSSSSKGTWIKNTFPLFGKGCLKWEISRGNEGCQLPLLSNTLTRPWAQQHRVSSDAPARN